MVGAPAFRIRHSKRGGPMNLSVHVRLCGLLLTAAWMSQGVALAQGVNPYAVYARNQVQLTSLYAQQQAANQQMLTNFRAVAASPYSGFDFYPNYNPGYYAPYSPYVPPVVPPVASPYVPGGGYGYGYGANPYVPNDPSIGNPYNPYN